MCGVEVYYSRSLGDNLLGLCLSTATCMGNWHVLFMLLNTADSILCRSSLETNECNINRKHIKACDLFAVERFKNCANMSCHVMSYLH